jgi:hypothetical protein
VNIWDYCQHGYGSDGHGDLFDENRFEAKEAAALALLRERGASLDGRDSDPLPRVRSTTDVLEHLVRRNALSPALLEPKTTETDPSAFWRAQIARTRLENRLLKGEFAGARGLYWSARRAYDDPAKRLVGLVAVLLSPRLFAKATATRASLAVRTPSGE